MINPKYLCGHREAGEVISAVLFGFIVLATAFSVITSPKEEEGQEIGQYRLIEKIETKENGDRIWIAQDQSGQKYRITLGEKNE